MILDDPHAPAGRMGGHATLDRLLARAAQRRPDALALVDPPNRGDFTDGAPRRLTFAEVDRLVFAIAGRLRRIGLRSDAIVGIQTGNTVESVLALLGVLRAGMIAMPLPLLWRRADVVAAASRLGVSALIVGGRVGGFEQYDLAMQVAVEVFPIRHVCGFGPGAPDGVITLDDLFTARTFDPLPDLETERAEGPGPAAHLAVITWDACADGYFPVARSHAELIAGGLAMVLEASLRQDSVLLATLTLSSFAGLTMTVLPWLIRGGTLVLHQPFDAEVFLTQIDMHPVDTVVVPGTLAPQLAEIGRLTTSDTTVIGGWRAPERLARAMPWRGSRARLVDVQVFGEIGIAARRRGEDGSPVPIPFGAGFTLQGANGGKIVAMELAATAQGTLALRGPMVPRRAFPPGSERSDLPYLRVAPTGFVDTGYACRPGFDTVVLRSPPPGIVTVGGCRLVQRDLESLVGRAEDGAASLAVLPDVLAGHRLAGIATDHDTVERALTSFGSNALLAAAFRTRGRHAA